MTVDQLAAFGLFAAVAAGTPGPANILVAATAANVGTWRAVPCLLGVAVGTGALIGVVAVGLGTVLLEFPAALLLMKGLGAALLLWLSWQIATSGAPDDGKEHTPVGFFTAAALQWINPKSWTVAASATGAFLTKDAGDAWLQAATFAGVFSLVAIPAVGIWLLFGAAMHGMLRVERTRRMFNIAMGVLLACSVVMIVF